MAKDAIARKGRIAPASFKPLVDPAPVMEERALAHSQDQSSSLLSAHSSLRHAVRDVLQIVDESERLQILRGAPDAWADRYVVDVTVGAHQGVHVLQQQRYRLLVIDLHADGFDVLHVLRSHPELRPPAVLVLGNLDLQNQVWGAIEAGADDYLAISCDAKDLQLRIDLWLRRVGAASSNPNFGLRIHSLGHFSVMCDGELCLQETGRARKVNTLFKYLLAHHERAVHTGEVFDLIWPDTAEKVAATDLRSLLHQLRRLLYSAARQDSYIQHGVTTLGLRLSPADWWDVQEFTAWTREAAYWQKAGVTDHALSAYEAAIELYQGDFLCDDRYAGWVLPIRNRLREQWLQALTAAAALHAAREEYEAQEAVLRTLLSADPYREHNLRALMELLAAQGRGAEALMLYHELRDRLLTELDAYPDPETCTLATYIGHRSR